MSNILLIEGRSFLAVKLRKSIIACSECDLVHFNKLICPRKKNDLICQDLQGVFFKEIIP